MYCVNTNSDFIKKSYLKKIIRGYIKNSDCIVFIFNIICCITKLLLNIIIKITL